MLAVGLIALGGVSAFEDLLAEQGRRLVQVCFEWEGDHLKNERASNAEGIRAVEDEAKQRLKMSLERKFSFLEFAPDVTGCPCGSAVGAANCPQAARWTIELASEPVMSRSGRHIAGWHADLNHELRLFEGNHGAGNLLGGITGSPTYPNKKIYKNIYEYVYTAEELKKPLFDKLDEQLSVLRGEGDVKRYLEQIAVSRAIEFGNRTVGIPIRTCDLRVKNTLFRVDLIGPCCDEDCLRDTFKFRDQGSGLDGNIRGEPDPMFWKVYCSQFAPPQSGWKEGLRTLMESKSPAVTLEEYDAWPELECTDRGPSPSGGSVAEMPSVDLESSIVLSPEPQGQSADPDSPE